MMRVQHLPWACWPNRWKLPYFLRASGVNAYTDRECRHKVICRATEQEKLDYLKSLPELSRATVRKRIRGGRRRVGWN